MPKWAVHNYTAKNFCNIPEDVCNEINRFIDFNPLGHDVGRVIVDGHWIPEPLLYLGLVVYEKWGYYGVKCMLHHNLLDYAYTLASTGPYGVAIRRGVSPAWGFINPEARIKEFVHRVLDNIVKDFSPALDVLERGGDVYDVIQRVESSGLWSVKYLDSFVEALKEPHIINFLRDLIKAVNELKEYIDLCINEVLKIAARPDYST
jgi:transcription termination factor NusB